jgi:hypothetical protein
MRLFVAVGIEFSQTNFLYPGTLGTTTGLWALGKLSARSSQLVARNLLRHLRLGLLRLWLRL